MSLDLVTTARPAGIGGIDLSGIDAATAVFNATGGGYGAPVGPQTAEGGTPAKTPDWLTNFGGTIADDFDFSQPPADRDAEIKLLAEPDGSHPLLDLFKGDEEPHFANGGPEGAAWIVPVAAVAIVGAVLVAADHLSGGAICDALGWKHGKYTNPDAETGTLQAPSEMLADLLARAGVPGIDTSSVEITDILSRLSDRMGKIGDLVGALAGAAQSGDAGSLDGLLKLAGLDGAGTGTGSPPADALIDTLLANLGIAGGLEGQADWAAATGLSAALLAADSGSDLAAWLRPYIDDFA